MNENAQTKIGNSNHTVSKAYLRHFVALWFLFAGAFDYEVPVNSLTVILIKSM
jgi:hypothetical protein